MTDSKKSAHSASSPKSKRAEALHKKVNAPNAVPYEGSINARRHLYSGMLYPSRIIAAKEMEERNR